MASIGPIGNTIFTNQMIPVVATNQTANDNRVEFQNMIAQAEVQERDEKVLDLRPAEENQGLNEDREHTRDEADRENKRSKKDQESEEKNELEEYHQLDIKV